MAFWPKPPPAAMYVVPGPSVGRPDCGSIEPVAPCWMDPMFVPEHAVLIAPPTMPPASSSIVMLSSTTLPLALLQTLLTSASEHLVLVQNCFGPHEVPHAPQFCGSF